MSHNVFAGSGNIRNGSFPPLLIDMISVGEQTGKIDMSLRRAAERYDMEPRTTSASWRW